MSHAPTPVETVQASVPSGPRRAWWPWLALCVDLVLVVVFVAIGQREHTTAAGALGLLRTASPFLVALLVTSALTLLPRTWDRLWPQGVLVWIGTVALGLALRVAWGLGDAPASFALVAAGVLGVFLLGRRALTGWLARR